MRIAALILAAGEGSRMGLGYNKMFLKLRDKPLLAHTLAPWQTMGEIDQLVVVTSQRDRQQVEDLVKQYHLNRVTNVVVGGKTRQESVYRGLSSLKENEPEVVLIHDGARPFVTPPLIRTLIAATVKHGAAIVAVPVKDTIKVAEQGRISTTLDRSRLWAAQTPQGVRYSLILDAHHQAQAVKREGTDDASLVEAMGHLVYIVQGYAGNLKVTTPDDIDLALALLQKGGNM